MRLLGAAAPDMEISNGGNGRPERRRLDDGDFVVTWSAFSATTGWDIYARQYDATGNALGEAFVVNAETDPNPQIDLTSAAPSFAQLMNSISGSQIRRYNFETLVTMDSMLAAAGLELRRLGHEVTTHMIVVDFDEFEDDDERRYYKLLPTSFSLTDTEVDDLRNAGRTLLRESKKFQYLVELLQ